MKLKNYINITTLHDFDLFIDGNFYDTMKDLLDIPEEFEDYKVELFSDLNGKALYIKSIKRRYY